MMAWEWTYLQDLIAPANKPDASTNSISDVAWKVKHISFSFGNYIVLELRRQIQ
jgi:hypothetical protein